MPTAPGSFAARALALSAEAAFTALALAGCTASSPTGSASSGSATSQAGASGSGGSSSGTTEPAPSATPTGGAGALASSPFTRDCALLAPDATVSAAYPGMTPAKADAPARSDAAVIGAYDGTVCTWATSTGTSMTLAVGRFDDDSLTRLKNSLVTSSNAVPTYRGEGYFDLVDGVGTAEAFTGSYWIIAMSDDASFGEPGGAEPIVDAAISSLSS